MSFCNSLGQPLATAAHGCSDNVKAFHNTAQFLLVLALSCLVRRHVLVPQKLDVVGSIVAAVTSTRVHGQRAPVNALTETIHVQMCQQLRQNLKHQFTDLLSNGLIVG